MKYLISFTLLFSFLFTINTSAQISAEEVVYDYQIAYCMGPENSTAWIGENLVIMIEAETPQDRNIETMQTMMNIFEDIILKYQEFTGLTNLSNAAEYDGKPVIEVVLDNCGAGGLANHGVMGMSTGTFFLDQFYDLIEQDNLAVPQVFLYELNRNFWMPAFNNKFDWAMNDEAQNWGWWTVGMNNAQAYIIPKALDLDLYYFGNNINYWEERMVNELESYLDDTQYDFDYGWRQSLMPWHNTESINDMMSGLLIYSYNNFGGEEWISGFYEHIQNDTIIDRSGVFAYQECRDNIYQIWSLAADEDLISFFENDLRWIISDEMKDEMDYYFNPPVVLNIEESVTGISVFPNPAQKYLQLSGNFKSNSFYEIVNLKGAKILSGNISVKEKIDIANLLPGHYILNVDSKSFNFIKSN